MPCGALRQSNARSSQSLTVNSDGMRPHLQLQRALETRNPIPVIIILAILLTNLLALALSADRWFGAHTDEYIADGDIPVHVFWLVWAL